MPTEGRNTLFCACVFALVVLPCKNQFEEWGRVFILDAHTTLWSWTTHYSPSSPFILLSKFSKVTPFDVKFLENNSFLPTRRQEAVTLKSMTKIKTFRCTTVISVLSAQKCLCWQVEQHGTAHFVKCELKSQFLSSIFAAVPKKTSKWLLQNKRLGKNQSWKTQRN